MTENAPDPEPLPTPAIAPGSCAFCEIHRSARSSSPPVSSKSTGGQLAVTEQSPNLCKLLFLTLDKNMFGGAQVRIDDIESGGMLVKGNGNVQLVIDRGCVEVDGTLTYDKKVDDDTMLRLAKTAAERVS